MIYTRDPDREEELGHLSVSNKEQGVTILEIGDAHLHVVSSDGDPRSPSMSAGSDAASPVRRHSASSIESGLARLSGPPPDGPPPDGPPPDGPSPNPSSSAEPSAAPSPMQMDDDRDGRLMPQRAAQQASGQKRGRSSPLDAGRLVDGQRPASRAEPGSRRASIDNDNLPDHADSLFPGTAFSASSRDTSPAAGARRISPGTAANPIDVSIPAVIDLTRVTPWPSMGALHPAASADEMEALPIRRQAMSREQKTAFDKQRLACLSHW